jgi:uncharacterized membrane protein YsdA (DUF1294 family)
MGIDKQKAKKNKRRIPEKTLMLLGILGGSLGVWAGMKVFSHKTRKPKFSLGIPIVILVHMALIGYYFW